MKQFKIKENGFEEVRKQIIMRTIPIVLIAVVFGLVIFEFNPNNTNTSDIKVYPYVTLIMIGALAFGVNKGIKRQKAIYDTYLLTIDDSGVTRKQGNTPSIKLLFSEIKRITKTNQGGFVITGKNSTNSIIVPGQVENLNQFENLLKENCSISIDMSKPILQRLMIPIIVAVLGLMAITYISSNKILVLVCGTILTAILIWSFVKIQTNKNIDKKTRKSSYWVILVLFSIVGGMIFKLMN